MVFEALARYGFEDSFAAREAAALGGREQDIFPLKQRVGHSRSLDNQEAG